MSKNYGYMEGKRGVGCKPRTIAGICNRLRRLFRYAELRGWVGTAIAHDNNGPRVPRFAAAAQVPASSSREGPSIYHKGETVQRQFSEACSTWSTIKPLSAQGPNTFAQICRSTLRFSLAVRRRTTHFRQIGEITLTVGGNPMFDMLNKGRT
jgi:hypothetical protein